jgi:hypothetical protein
LDFLNDDALARLASVQAGTLRAGTGAYSVVIVPDVQYMPPESLDCFMRFVQEGGFLIFIGRVPAAAPGLEDNDGRTARLGSVLKALWGNQPPRTDVVETCGKGKVVLSGAPSGILTHLSTALTPDFKILQAGDSSDSARRQARDNVGFLHRKTGEVDTYFISNISSFWQELRVQFSVGHKTPQRWNPESGEIDDTLVFRYSSLAGSNSAVTEVQVRLAPYESCFVIFTPTGNGPTLTNTNWPGALKIEKAGNKTRVTGLIAKNGEYFLTDAAGKTHRFQVKGIPQPIPLNGPWSLTLGEKTELALSRLQSWNDLLEGKDYSGWAVYETDFEMSGLGEQTEWDVDLGVVHETAQVILNGIDLGSAWKGSRILPCGKALRLGSNHLKVEVGNLWIQRVQSLPKPDLKALAETFGIRWGTYGEIKPEKIPPSGLLGPVQLIPRRQWVAKL